MLKDIAFGQYYPAPSPIHRLDARTKIVATILYITALFLAQSYVSLGIITAFLLTVIFISHVPFRSVLRSLKPVLILIIITFLFNLVLPAFFPNTFSRPKVEWEVKLWIMTFTDTGVNNSIVLTLRLLLIVTGTSLLTFTTTPVALTDGIESLLYPLKLVRFPVHELALIMSIALRFIPILLDETDRIMQAQKARGADFDTGNVFRRAKAMLPVLIPLLISAFRRADELAEAMDSRCYSGAKGRTKFRKPKFAVRDLIAALAVAALFAFVLTDKLLPIFAAIIM